MHFYKNMVITGRKRPDWQNSWYLYLSLANIGTAILFALLMLNLHRSIGNYQSFFLIFLPLQFITIQILSLNLAIKKRSLSLSTWLIIISLSFAVVAYALIVKNDLLTPLGFLVTIPLFVAATNQLNRLPAALFLTFTVSALAISIDIFHPYPEIQIERQNRNLLLYQATGLFFYLLILIAFSFKHSLKNRGTGKLRVNLTTQYALVLSTMSALVICLVTGVLITQIRHSQINQVGRNYQTIAENFAKLAGSHLEQQTQKLRLITEQIPLFKEGLQRANKQYNNDKKLAKHILAEKNQLWQGPDQDNEFIMHYLNSPIIEALSRFRGHNSFHNNMVLIDKFGGLVASLGPKPTSFYFNDNHWWEICWNNGLGNIFIGDLETDKNSQIPKLRIVIDIINHSTNQIIGFLSSKYILRTLVEDLTRFIPDSVDQISLITGDGQIIFSTDRKGETNESPLFPSVLKTSERTSSGWSLDKDNQDQKSLIGFSALSTAYDVISDPLKRLGWYIVVSGSQSKALSGVSFSTKLAMVVGLAAMALGVLGALAAARVVARPIENLTATALSISNGNLYKKAEPEGPVELIALANGFNTLTNELHKVITNLQSQTTQLEKAKSEAEAATKLKGEFLANMSHEIRTPLNAILGFADILESCSVDEKQRNHAAIIKTSGMDLLQLINDILDLSKIEAGRMEINLTPVDMRALFLELNRIFSISAKEKNLQIDMKVGENVPQHLLIDRIRLKQILFNLIGNGVKFTNEGGVYCHANVSQNPGINNWNLLITVRDTGVGIDPQHYNDLFQTFKQGKDSTAAQIEGTGLGLTISKSLVEMMGGTISVKGKQGHGTLFSVHLNNIEETHQQHQVKHLYESHDIHFSPAKILVVDDLEVNRKLIAENIRPFELEITETQGGREALATLKTQKFDVVLLDIRMPDMDGFQTLKRIRDNKAYETLPVIAITASGMTGEIQKIQSSGFTDFLLRPFSQEELIDKLSNVLPHNTYRKEKQEKNNQHEETFALGDEFLNIHEKISDEITHAIYEEWKNVKDKQSIPDIEKFADNLKQLARQHSIRTLSSYSRDLRNYVRAFDIDKMEKHLASFEIIIRQLQSSMNDRGK